MIILVLMWFLSVPMLNRLSSNQITVERGSTVILLNPNSLHMKSCCRFRWESSISGHQNSADRLGTRAAPHGSWTLDALLDKYLSIWKDHKVDCLRDTGKSALTTILWTQCCLVQWNIIYVCSLATCEDTQTYKYGLYLYIFIAITLCEYEE